MERSILERAGLAPCLMLVFAVLGIADAFYDAYAVHTGQPLWCPPPIDGCNEVANSPHARVFGVPLGYLGVVFYGYMAGLAALLVFDPGSRGLRLGVLLHALLGVSGSVAFMYIQFTFIHAFCIYCAISAVLTLLLLVTAVRAARNEEVRVRPRKPWVPACAGTTAERDDRGSAGMTRPTA